MNTSLAIKPVFCMGLTYVAVLRGYTHVGAKVIYGELVLSDGISTCIQSNVSKTQPIFESCVILRKLKLIEILS